MSNDQSSFHVIDLKLDIEPSLTPQRRVLQPMTLQLDARRCLQHATRWSQLVERSDEYLCTGGALRKHRLSKQAGTFRVDSAFRTCFNF